MAEVLVVDDSSTMRKTIVHALEGAGYGCDQAENGAEGRMLHCIMFFRTTG